MFTQPSPAAHTVPARRNVPTGDLVGRDLPETAEVRPADLVLGGTQMPAHQVPVWRGR